jgi:hypothetical protein
MKMEQRSGQASSLECGIEGGINKYLKITHKLHICKLFYNAVGRWAWSGNSPSYSAEASNGHFQLVFLE